MTRTNQFNRRSLDIKERLLYDILATLEEMKEQEREYWETWRKAKDSEWLD